MAASSARARWPSSVSSSSMSHAARACAISDAAWSRAVARRRKTSNVPSTMCPSLVSYPARSPALMGATRRVATSSPRLDPTVRVVRCGFGLYVSYAGGRSEKYGCARARPCEAGCPLRRFVRRYDLSLVVGCGLMSDDAPFFHLETPGAGDTHARRAVVARILAALARSLS